MSGFFLISWNSRGYTHRRSELGEAKSLLGPPLLGLGGLDKAQEVHDLGEPRSSKSPMVTLAFGSSQRVPYTTLETSLQIYSVLGAW